LGGVGWRVSSGRPGIKNNTESHTVDYGPFITSQPASSNQLEGVMWCAFGHVAPQILGERTVGAAQSGLPRDRVLACRKWISNPSGKCSYERPTRGTVCGTMRSMCGAGAGCLAINYQSLRPRLSRLQRTVLSGSELISQRVSTKSFCTNQFPHKSVNVSFVITNINNELTDLCGN